MSIESSRHRIGRFAVCLIIVLAAAWPALAKEKKGKPAEKPKAEKPDPFVVPDGTPAELLQYVEGLKKQRSVAFNRDAVVFFRKKMNGAILKAAEKILAAEPNDEQAKAAVELKIGSLIGLERLGVGSAVKRLEAFPAELKKAGHPKLAREVRGFLLAFQMHRAMTAGPEKIEEIIKQVGRYLAEAPPARTDVRLAMMAAQVAEMSGNNQLAATAYSDFGKIFAASDDAAVARIGQKMNGAARRMNLVGQKMKVEGTTLAGELLDWSKYAGKVVLVNFWASWCKPCRAEIPNIRKNYDFYHDRGFEVVAVNCDENREQVEAFLKKTPMPGTVLFSDQKGAAGMDNPTASYYGILGIPALILVGADGNVVSLQARGPALGKELEKLLGPVEKKNDR